MRKLSLAALLPLLFAACGEPNLIGCPAVVNFEQGLVHIDSAALGSTALTGVNITNITVDGGAYTPAQVLSFRATRGQVYGVRADGSTLVCDLSCAFGIPAHYTFDVGVAGGVTQHEDLTISLTQVASTPGTCDGYYTGTPVHLNLKFAAAP